MLCVVIILGGWIVSVCIHEFCHALVAYWGGDHTVRERGYLTFNPLKYADPVYTLVLPVIFLVMGGIALPGGAVYIRSDLLRSRWWRTAVSLVGPLANAVLAVFCAAPFLFGWLTPFSRGVAVQALAVLVNVQVMACVFNLIPLPPLDGFGCLAPWLPKRVREWTRSLGSLPLVLFFLLMLSRPDVLDPLWQLVHGLTRSLGVDGLQVQIGWSTFHGSLRTLLP